MNQGIGDASVLAGAQLRRVSPSFDPRPKQLSFLPLKTVVEMPDSTGTADAWGRVIAEDTHTYVVKGSKGGPRVPASEWVATHLAEAVNLPCATAKVIELRNGDLLFGSRVIGGPADEIETAAILTSMTWNGGRRIVHGLQSILSAIYAFDMFVNNIDRHDRNYLSTSDQNGTISFFVIDLGRSLFWSELRGFPSPHHWTRSCGKKIWERHGFDLGAAVALLGKISRLAPAHIASIMSAMPEEWMPPDERQKFVDWWSNGFRQARIDELCKGLSDGSLL